MIDGSIVDLLRKNRQDKANHEKEYIHCFIVHVCKDDQSLPQYAQQPTLRHEI
jgi:hypothetical protein